MDIIGERKDRALKLLEEAKANGDPLLDALIEQFGSYDVAYEKFLTLIRTQLPKRYYIRYILEGELEFVATGLVRYKKRMSSRVQVDGRPYFLKNAPE